MSSQYKSFFIGAQEHDSYKLLKLL